tara:strand:- start:714 stop:1286 length:573 start_codon:yes stop_codon:yes gene_type:complete
MQETFIESYQTDIEVCKDLIKYHKKNKEYKKAGFAYDNDLQNTVINKDVKDSIDVTFYNMSQNKTIKKYFSELSKCLQQYTDKYQLGRLHTYDANLIQYYPPGGGFKVWHCERYIGYTSGQFIAQRGLVYMTYLNDVTDGGETEFKYQKVKVKPEIGKTLIWPPDFTHLHRGIVSPTQEKYIATGWFILI